MMFENMMFEDFNSSKTASNSSNSPSVLLGVDGIKDGRGVHARRVGDELGASRVDLGELGQVVGLAVEHHPAIFLAICLENSPVEIFWCFLVQTKSWEPFGGEKIKFRELILRLDWTK